MALLQSADGAVMGAYDRGLDLGFFPELGEVPEDFDPGLSALDTRYPWPQQTVFADFDGDGFADQLRFEEALTDPADPASPRTWSVTLHRAERSASQGRVLAMTGPWGGTTMLDWTFTAMGDQTTAAFAEGRPDAFAGSASRISGRAPGVLAQGCAGMRDVRDGIDGAGAGHRACRLH